MIYIEVQMTGQVSVFDLSEKLIILRATVDAQASHHDAPHTEEEAQDYFRARCFKFHPFDEIEQAQDWADEFDGFRAGEIRAELARFRSRQRDLHRLRAIAA